MIPTTNPTPPHTKVNVVHHARSESRGSANWGCSANVVIAPGNQPISTYRAPRIAPHANPAAAHVSRLRPMAIARWADDDMS